MSMNTRVSEQLKKEPKRLLQNTFFIGIGLAIILVSLPYINYNGLTDTGVEIAGEIHDIVGDTLWVKYNELPILSAKIVEAIKEAEAFKEKHAL